MAGLRRFVRSLVPPLVFDLYLHLRHGHHLGPIWRGIHPHRRDVSVRGPGFDGATWQRWQEGVLTRVRADRPSDGATPIGVTRHHLLLPLVTAMLGSRSGPVRILDFGGGIGLDYALLRSALVGPGRIAYQVVDGDITAATGRRVHAGDEDIRFLTALPPALERFDVVYASSSLQFVDDYAGVLRALCAYGAPRLLLANHPIGDITTYAAEQRNVAGSVLAAWFFSFNEIVELVQSCGYHLVFKAAGEETYAQDAYPPDRRIGRFCHLLFLR